MKIIKFSIITLIVFFVSAQDLLPQQRITARGTSTFRKVGVMRGNQVRTVFSNYGVIAQPGSEGPRGAWKYDANGYVGDVSPLVGLRLPIKDYRKGTTPLDGIPDTLYSVIITPVDRPGGGEGGGGKAWGFEPIPDFANSTLDELGKGVAMSNLPETWPSQWPDYPTWTYSGLPIIKEGVDVSPLVDWNGYFGRGKKIEDGQESYFWMDDFNDEEVQLRNDFVPDTTDPTRTGQAIQVSVRALQWADPLAQDVIFWLYNIKNDGTQTYGQAVFGTLVGTYVGVEAPEYNDDASFFNVRENITYTWDFDRYISPSANPQWRPDPTAVGYIAYAFLESPGNQYDGIDNDGDDAKYGGNAAYFGETDFVKRTINSGSKVILIDPVTFQRSTFPIPNDTITVHSMGYPFFIQPGVTQLVEGDVNLITAVVNPNSRDGIDNDLDGIIDENYQVHYRQYKKSESGIVLFDTLAPVQYKDYIANVGVNDKMIDEGRDDNIDNDGDWDMLYDDVGADGKAETHDAGEGDRVPTPGEPNFDEKDVDESDQIGLTSFQYFVPANDIVMSNDIQMWGRMVPGYFDVPTSIVNSVAIRGEDGDFMYGAGYFPLLPGKTERFSLALAFGDNYSDVLITKRVAQKIYDANYTFPEPPAKPTLTAVGSDKQVTLYWNKVAENSIDPTTKERDFEGYKIYKGTDPDFTDAFVITDVRGIKRGYKALVQYDLKNSITGYFPDNKVMQEEARGIPFYLGDDTGIQNFYVDNDVINGRRYYYAVTAYDRGSLANEIRPKENSRFASIDALGRISTDINTISIVPNAPVAGYVPPKSGEALQRETGNSTAQPYFEVIDPTKIGDSTYTVTFTDSVSQGVSFAYAYTVTNLSSGRVVLDKAKMSPNNGDVFEGVRLSIDTSYQAVDSLKSDPRKTKWNNPAPKNLKLLVSQFTSTTVTGIKSPKDYVAVFSDAYADSSDKLTAIFGNNAPPARKVNFKLYDITDLANPQRIKFVFSEGSPYRKDTLSFNDQVTISNADGTKITWKVVFAGDSSSLVPKGGDSLFISIYKPISGIDKFKFVTQAPAYDVTAAREQLNKVKAVPNPYVVTNVFERPLPTTVRGRGERVINFINLPPSSKIHIYTSSGDHIRTLEHDGNIANGTVSWDVRTKEGLDVAYGVYFYVVEVNGISDKKMGKLAIIK